MDLHPTNTETYHRIKSLSLQSDNDTDAALVRSVTKEMLQRLCSQYNISTQGTKPQLIQRLRAYADEQIQKEKSRRKDRIRRIERGADDDHDGNTLSGKAKHTIVESSDFQGSFDEEDEDDLDGVFYFAATMHSTNTSTHDTVKQVSNSTMDTSSIHPPKNKWMAMTTPAAVTAPPMHPDIQPNEKGERSVTIYSTTDQNDLTSITSHLSSNSPDMMNAESLKSSSSTAKKYDSTLLGGPFGESAASQRKKEGEQETEMADEALTDLIRNLLAMTGAPGFQEHSMDDEDEIITLEEQGSEKNFVQSFPQKHHPFVGFDPSLIPTSMIMESSKHLRRAGGESLRRVLSEFEMQAIGFDGRAGDDKRKGGGHYLEVQKVAAFLNGFRVAEVRRVARQTTSLLLDKLITEGVQGLDRTLMVMSRGGDESSDVGELNDSLLSYLDQVIKDQEKNQASGLHTQTPASTSPTVPDSMRQEDSDLWNVTQTADGVVEILNPNDPRIIKALEHELSNSPQRTMKPTIRLITVLKLLRERIKAEALYPNDEKGQNLRVLAYCLRAQSENEWKNLILEYFGSSLGVS
jgi:hypothetical protein